LRLTLATVGFRFASLAYEGLARLCRSPFVSVAGDFLTQEDVMPKTKEEHFRDLLTAHNDMNATLSKRFLGSSFDAHAGTLASLDAAIAERDEARARVSELEQVHASADDRIEELKRELKNAREANSVPKPPASADVEGPFHSSTSSIFEDGNFIATTIGSPRRYVRLLNHGVRAEKLQARVAELELIRVELVKLFGWEDESALHATMHVSNAVNNLRADLALEKSRADAAEAREKALRELVERWRADLKGDSIEDLKKASWYVQREIQRRTKAKDG
jgi:hypothetical protein